MIRRTARLLCLIPLLAVALLAPFACRRSPRLPDLGSLWQAAASGTAPVFVQGPAGWFGPTTAKGPDCSGQVVSDLKAQHAPDSVFQAVVVRLFEKCPVGAGVIVHVTPLADKPYWGVTNKCGDVFVIEIAAEAPEAQQIDILTHEWAHAMVWGIDTPDGRSDPHGQAWGMAFSRAYMTALDGAGH